MIAKASTVFHDRRWVWVSIVLPSLHRRLPVHEERDGGGGVGQDRVDQEAAVAGDGVLLINESRTAAPDPRLEERRRRARLDRGALRVDRDGHQPAVWRNVIQFLSV